MKKKGDVKLSPNNGSVLYIAAKSDADIRKPL